MLLIKHLFRYIYFRVKFPFSKTHITSRVSLDSLLDKGVIVLDSANIGDCKIGRHSYVGVGCKLERTTIGPFSSLGPEVMSGAGIHPLNFISTYPGFYTNKVTNATWFGAIHEFVDLKRVNIGADVWIGARAIIMGGVSIGHGAVIGAGSIVTKDVPPYAIVVGSPAKIIRYRFNESLCKKLIASEWWETSDEILSNLSGLATDPEKFIDTILEMNNITQK